MSNQIKIPLFILTGTLALIATAYAIIAIKHQHQIAQESERLKAQQDEAFNQTISAIAAIKVCTEGTTYDEFRQRELAFEIAYEANKPMLSRFDADIQQLLALDKACDLCWFESINYGGQEDIISPNWTGSLAAMKLIHPAITNELNLPVEQWGTVPDFYGKNYIQWGLAKINLQCESLLAEMRTQE
jgi:hypothetical protein